MTAGEIALYGWELAGEDPRYDGEDLTTTEGIATLRKLNSAYMTICSYKFPRTGLIRFRALERSTVWKSTVSTGNNLVTFSDNVTASVDAALGAPDVGDVLHVASQNIYYEILSSSLSGGSYTCKVAPASPATGTPTSANTLYKSRLIDLTAQPTGVSDGLTSLATAGKVVEVFDVYDLTNRREVYRSSNTDFFDNVGLNPTPPAEYVRVERNKVLLDAAPASSDTLLRIRFAQLPDDFTLAADTPVIPEQYHEAIAQRMATQLLLQQQDYEGARELRLTYENELRRLQTEYERGWDNTPGTIMRDQ